MACTFPTYDQVTGAEILNVVFPKASIGRYNEASIIAENSSSNSIIGQAITYFNTLATNNNIDFSALSDDKCDKLRMSLRWYIVGKYKQHDLELDGCPNCFETDEMVCHAFEMACNFMKLVSTEIHAVASFCSHKKTEDGFTDFYGTSGYSPCNCE